MNTKYKHFQAEYDEINKLLEQTPEENVIDRMSLQIRKETIESALSEVQYCAKEPVRASLNFHGKPVVGGHGIFAEFAVVAINKFVDAVTALAASLTGPLGARGNIPKRDSYQLLITGTVLGSFGFEMEEYQSQPILEIEGASSQVEQAFELARNLIEASLGSDDNLADVVSETETRAVSKLQEFLKTMADQEAYCQLLFREKKFSFKDVDEVRQSAERLSQNNIYCEDEDLFGEFQGVLPKRRTFEFKLLPSEEVISGKVGPEIEEASEINDILKQPVKIKVVKTRVGSGLPRYVLSQYEKNTNQSDNQIGKDVE